MKGADLALHFVVVNFRVLNSLADLVCKSIFTLRLVHLLSYWVKDETDRGKCANLECDSVSTGSVRMYCTALLRDVQSDLPCAISKWSNAATTERQRLTSVSFGCYRTSRSCFVFGRSRVKILARIPTVLTEVFLAFLRPCRKMPG
jgi:hypothetical protein